MSLTILCLVLVALPAKVPAAEPVVVVVPVVPICSKKKKMISTIESSRHKLDCIRIYVVLLYLHFVVNSAIVGSNSKQLLLSEVRIKFLLFL